MSFTYPYFFPPQASTARFSIKQYVNSQNTAQSNDPPAPYTMASDSSHN